MIKKGRKTIPVYERISLGLKEPKNFLICLFLFAVTIIGILDNNLEIIAVVYFFAFLLGLLLRLIFFFLNKISNRKTE